jgi:hypothetical protein
MIRIEMSHREKRLSAHFRQETLQKIEVFLTGHTREEIKERFRLRIINQLL